MISVYDRETNCQVYQDRFQTLEWGFQKQKIFSVAKHYNNALVFIDATGLGDPIADDLSRMGLAIEPMKLTNESKKQIIEKMMIWTEQEKIRMINIPETINEFNIFTYDISAHGKIIYNAPQGFHDDIVIANCLAVWGLQTLYKKAGNQELNPVQEALQKALGGQSNEIREEDYNIE